MVWKTDAVDLETLLEYVTKEMKLSVAENHSLMINMVVFPFLDLVYIMLTWGLSFLSDMALYFSLCYFPSAVICHCELWLHKLVFTKIHTHTLTVFTAFPLDHQDLLVKWPAEAENSVLQTDSSGRALALPQLTPSFSPRCPCLAPWGWVTSSSPSPLPLLSLMEVWSWWRGLVNNLGALVHFITWPARLVGTFALSALV